MSVKQSLLIEEVRRRKAQGDRGPAREKADQLFSSLFPAQQAFVRDPSKRKAAMCSRRAGKSHCVLIYALITCLYRPGAEILVLVRTRGQAKRIFWRTLKRLCAEYDVKGQFKNMDLEWHCENGSVIYFSGADTSEEVDKYRGSHFDLVIIDEGKSYSKRLLDELIEDILLPALADDDGTLVMIGTPPSVEAGYFWAVITLQADYTLFGEERPRKFHVHKYDPAWKGSVHHWSLHYWSAKDNVKKPHIWERYLQEKADNGWEDNDPHWLRERLGLFVSDPSGLVYLYNKVPDQRCNWTRDPEGPHGLPTGHEWRYLLGIDLGWHDDTAFVVAAWSPTHKALHYIHVEKHPYMTTNDVMARVAELEGVFGGFDARIVDPAAGGKRLAEDLGQTYGVYVESARKQDKCAYIALMNADITAGKIKVDPEGLLADEWRVMQWGNHEKTEVDKACADHASDAALYVWRFAQHHWAHEKVLEPTRGTPEWERQRLRKEREQLQKERAALLKRDTWQRHQSLMNQLPLSARKLPGWNN